MPISLHEHHLDRNLTRTGENEHCFFYTSLMPVASLHSSCISPSGVWHFGLFIYIIIRQYFAVFFKLFLRQKKHLASLVFYALMC